MSTFNLDQYLERLGYTGTLKPDVDTLTAVHRAHVAAIPFENLDIQMGRPVSLDPEALQAKIVRRRRGGYCFEQNSVFALALRTIGFAVDTCEARVRQQAAGIVRPRTHMALRVTVGKRDWLADVGFGGDGLTDPVALDATSSEQLGSVYRATAEGSLRVLQRQSASGWEDLYVVLPDAAHPVDFEMANWFTSTYPRSPFVLTLTAQRINGGVRHLLRNLTYSSVRGTVHETRDLIRSELVPLLRGTFGLDVPDSATFRALD